MGNSGGGKRHGVEGIQGDAVPETVDNHLES